MDTIQRVGLLSLAALTVVCFSVAALARPLHPDNLLYLHGANQILNGARLYRDIVDMNPPATFLVNVPPVLVAQWTGIATHDALVAFVAILGVGSSWLCYQMTRAFRAFDRAQPEFVGLCCIVSLFAIPRADFGQREHLIAILILPYAFACALRLQGTGLGRTWTWISAAMLALAVLMKPFYGCVWLCLEGYSFLRLRPSVRGLLRAGLPFFVALLVGIAVTATVFLDYWRIVQLANRYYQSGFRNSIFDIAYRPQVRVWVPFALLIWAIPSRSETKPLRSALGVSSLSSLMSALLQQKGWGYHFLPALTSLGVWGGLASLDVFPSDRGARLRCLRFGTLAFILPLANVLALWRPWHVLSARQSRVEQWQTPLSRMLTRCGSSPSVFGMALDLRATWTAVHYTGARWSSRYYHPWPLAGLAKEGVGSTSIAPNLAPESVALAKQIHDQIAEDLLAHRPDLLVLDTAQLFVPGWGLPLGWNQESYLRSHFKLQSFLNEYTPLGEFGFLRVYGRSDICETGQHD